ncbi:MATE family efflux transporter [Patescibacteria group bacterium]|nr:MATE family efflux transporter [Patescibacteria group bacterium]
MKEDQSILNKLTEGSIFKALVVLSVPIIIANIFQTVYQLTDAFWVGRLGEEAVAAVSLSFPIIFLLISLGGGLAIAGTILVAQYKGKEDQKNIDFISGQTLALMSIIAIITSIVGIFGSEFFIESMKQEAAVNKDAILYLQITFSGLIFMYIFFVFQNITRGVGDVKTAMYIVLATVFLNFALDPVFIYGFWVIPPLGVAGAAAATVGTQALSAIIGLIYLMSGKEGIHLKLRSLIPNWTAAKRLFKLGFPASIESSTRALGMVLMTFLVATFGTTIIATYGLGTRIMSFVIIPAIGLAMGTSTLVGQSIGAGKKNRAEQTLKVARKIGFLTLTAAGISLFIFAEPIVTIFIPGELNVIHEATLFVKIMSVTFGLTGIQMAYIGALRGSGNTKLAMNISIFILVIMLLFASITAKFTPLGYYGIWIATPVSSILGTLIAVFYVEKTNWHHTKVT